MSILNGKISSAIIRPEPMPFGEPYKESGFIKLKGAWDAAAMGDILVCAGFGELGLYRIHGTAEPEHISTLSGIGASRQLSIDSDYAYISTRADGVFVCDLRKPEAPVLAYQIDTLELATGVCAADGVLAVTNRHMGCEIFDVRNPYHPVRKGGFLCGEAQSVWLYDKLAVIGDWMNKQVRIFDIADPGNASELSSFTVDGFADGVCVYKRDGRLICLAAAGHHSARLKNRRKYQEYTYVTPEMLNDGYGCGHGVELFDITDPRSPEYLSSIKAPPLFGGIDTWRVNTDGSACYLTDSMNGIFAIDISDPYQPFFKNYFKLPPYQKQKISPPSIQPQSDAITGAASVGGRLYAASPNDGIHALDCAEPAGVFVRAFSSVNFEELKTPVTNSSEYRPFYSADGQLHSFAGLDGEIFCACGESGISVVDIDGNLKYTTKTPSICHDVCICKGFLLAAEGRGGVASYEIGAGFIRERSRIAYGVGFSARELVYSNGILCAELGSSHAAEIIISDDGILNKRGVPCNVGLLYYRHIARSAAGKYICAATIAKGPELLIRSEGGLKLAGHALGREACPIAEGVCGYKDKLICVLRGGYSCLCNPESIESLKDCDLQRVEGAKLDGMPFVFESRLVILNRYNGRVELLDITDPYHPRFVKRIETGFYPEFAERIDGRLLIACGYNGIIEVSYTD